MKPFWIILNWISSLKVAILLLLAIALASSIGTAIPQGEPIETYLESYKNHPWLGLINGDLLIKMQLHHVYTSFWFLALLIWLGIALMLCTWRRQWPTLKSALDWVEYNQANQIQRLTISETIDISDTSVALKKLKDYLLKEGWKVRLASGKLSARKGLIGRFGPPLVHFGLIFLMIGSTYGAFAGNRIENFVVPGRSINLISPDRGNKLKIKLNDFSIKRSPNGQPEQFISNLELNDPIKNQKTNTEVSVNHPLRYKGLTLYQADWALSAITIQFGNSPKLQFPLQNIPELGEQVWGVTLPRLKEDSEPVFLTVSNEQGPVFFYNQEGESIGRVNPGGGAENIGSFQIRVSKILPSSGLIIKYDPGVPLVYIGFAIIMLGGTMSIVSTKFLWALSENECNSLHIGGLCNRNLSGLANDFPKLLKEIS